MKVMEDSEIRIIRHYSSKHKILLVGEGDFSFSLCPASAFGSATNITATSLDSEDELSKKYMDAMVNVSMLTRFGCDVQHEGSSSASAVRRKRGDSYHTQHKTTYPFSDWEIKRLAKAEGLKLVKAESKFELSHYPGYTNKRGSGWTSE
ncbi:unnamed protein product [Brassica oleracea]|uniref:25S rRNA (uridine-N(3))-methyltransferase BMT5-like domain-containing protein n=1 Tax=Brassica oleracea var. oleracea TaxID=109376 RepID=A0A0D3A6M6_BRAOL